MGAVPGRASLSPSAQPRRLVRWVLRRAARPVLLAPESPVQQVRARVDGIDETMARLAAQADDLAVVARRLEDRIAEQVTARRKGDQILAQREAELIDFTHALEHVRRRVEAAEDGIASLEVLAARLQALPYAAGDRLAFADVDGSRVLTLRRAPAAGDGSYVDFEEVFRGTEERIRDLQRPYRALLHEPVLDFGCGRGELLDLLREWDMRALGVDADEGMVARCHRKGLDFVEHGDGLAYLEGLENGSLGTIFSAQVIEHLPYPALLRLLELALRKLQPGGALIAETVNPHAVDALKGFWLDPTHQHPLFPETMLVLAAGAGFADAWVTAPNGSGDFERDRLTVPAYALVARKPA